MENESDSMDTEIIQIDSGSTASTSVPEPSHPQPTIAKHASQVNSIDEDEGRVDLAEAAIYTTDIDADDEAAAYEAHEGRFCTQERNCSQLGTVHK